MATIEQIKTLIRHHFERSDEKFKTTVLQIAATEAKIGHSTQARELKELVERMSRNNVIKLNNPNMFFDVCMDSHTLSELIVSEDIYGRISKIIGEFFQRDKLRKYGLENRRKILLEGPSGTGKTMTATVIANELNMQLYIVQMDRLMSKFMGETGAKLRQIFESVANCTGVYLFDEFDAIGADRALDNEVGEMRRVLNTFLQMLEADVSDSIIIAATNNNHLLDQALYRRFDDVLHYDLPTEREIFSLLRNKLEAYFESIQISERIVDAAIGLSQAEIVRVCDDAIKLAILEDKNYSDETVLLFINERKFSYRSEEA